MKGEGGGGGDGREELKDFTMEKGFSSEGMG